MNLIKNSILITLLFFSIEVLSQTSINNIYTKADFDMLCGPPLSNKFGQVTSVKVVLDINTSVLYFINSRFFKYHYEFCSMLEGRQLDLSYFNELNYSDNPERDYLLANINYFQSIDKYVIEVSVVDLMCFEKLAGFYSKIKEACFFGNNLSLLLNSSRLFKAKDILSKKIPVINSSEIFLNLTYQPIGKFKNCGTLRIINNLDDEKNKIESKDIIVINKTPLYLPAVAGIIVSEFQTPLSHLTILGQNRKIPICAFKRAFSDTILRKFENQKIFLLVKDDTFIIEHAGNNSTEVTNFKAYIPKADLSVKTLVDIKDINKNSNKYVGNKASNLGILFKISTKAKFQIPESAFAIPFYFYNQHINKTSAPEIITKLLNTSDIRNNKDSLKYYLKKIRREIKDAQVDTALLRAIKEKITVSRFNSFRFRSSTNAEDAKGFSGAGLYSSATGIIGSYNKSVDKALKEVWASLWSFEAFSEREYFNISHENVFMGILVHRSFPLEGVNGVAITKNLYRPDMYGFIVNAQTENNKVVKPGEGVTCDQFICYPKLDDELFKNKNAIDIISLSNLNNGKLVMTEDEIQNLASKLEAIKRYFYNHTITIKSYLEYGLDIEFKLDGENRDLYIKQVRYYND